VLVVDDPHPEELDDLLDSLVLAHEAGHVRGVDGGVARAGVDLDERQEVPAPPRRWSTARRSTRTTA
jgi:hypothetical protein